MSLGNFDESYQKLCFGRKQTFEGGKIFSSNIVKLYKNIIYLQTEIGEDEEHGDLKKTGKCDTTRTEKEGVADADSCRRKCVPYVTRRSLIHGVLSQVKS